MSTVEIKIDGVDITDDVFIREAAFTSLVNGQTGPAAFKVKDVTQSYDFTSGGTLTVDIDSVRVWGGFVMRAIKNYLLIQDTTDPGALTRVWSIAGADYNIFFNKRIVYELADPSNKVSWDYDADTYDDTIINDIFDNFLEIGGDGLTRTGVTRIAKAILDVPGKVHSGLIASAGMTWKQVMDRIARETGGVYYISPTKDLVYVDVEDANSSYNLTDTPSGGSDIGYQGFNLFDDATKMVNDMFVWGSALGSDHIVFSRTTDSASIAEHGLRQLSLYSGGLYRQASADIVADSYVYGTPQSHRGGKDPAVTMSCRVFEPVFQCGQVVDTTVDIYGYNDALPIRRMTITFAGPSDPIFDLTLGHEVDQPVGIWEYKDAPRLGLGGGGKGPKPPPPPDPHVIGDPECLCGITDSFTRVVAPHSPPSSTPLGIADTGASWFGGPEQDIFETLSSVEVDGSKAILVLHGQDLANFALPGLKGLPSSGKLHGSADCSAMDPDGAFYGLELRSGSTWVLIGINLGSDTVIFGTGYTGPVTPGQLMSTKNQGSFVNATPVNSLTGPFTGQGFTLQWEVTSTTIKAKAWFDSDSDPGWQLNWTTTVSVSPNQFGTLIWGNDSSNSGTYTIEGIDIPGTDGCTSVQFDDFTRSRSDWGLATPSGLLWASRFSNHGFSSVNGSQGVQQVGATRDGSGAGAMRNWIRGDGPWPKLPPNLALGGSGIPDTGEFVSGIPFTCHALVKPAPNRVADDVGYFAATELEISNNFLWNLLFNNSGHHNELQLQLSTADGFGSAVVSATPDYNAYYHMLLSVDETSAKAKAWKDGDAEPDWMIDVSYVAYQSTSNGEYLQASNYGIIQTANGSSFNSTALWEYIEFGYPGQPCSPCSGAEGEAAVWDDFDRADSSSSWGTATSGVAYTYSGFGTFPGSGTKVYLDSGVGYLWQESSGGIIYFGSPAGGPFTGPFSEPQWTFSTKFKTPTWTYDGSDASIDGTGLVTFRAQDRRIFFYIGTTVDPDLVVQSHGQIQTDDSDDQEFDWHPDTWYQVKWYYNWVTGDSWLKVWVDGDAEPDWMITESSYGGAGGDTQVSYFEVHTNNFAGSGMPWTSGNPAIFGFDDISFTTCAPLEPTSPPGGSGVPSSGEVCETITHSVTSSDFAASHAFFSGSLKVWVNGALRTDVTYSASLGEFHLGSSIDPTDVLYICYRANGDPA